MDALQSLPNVEDIRLVVLRIDIFSPRRLREVPIKKFSSRCMPVSSLKQLSPYEAWVEILLDKAIFETTPAGYSFVTTFLVRFSIHKPHPVVSDIVIILVALPIPNRSS